MGAPVTGPDLPFWGWLGSPGGHPSADLHASHSTDPGGALHSTRLWKVPHTPLTFTVSQPLSALVLSAQMMLCPLPLFLVNSSSSQEHTRLPDLSLHLESNVSTHCLFCPVIPLELLKISILLAGPIEIPRIISLFFESPLVSFFWRKTVQSSLHK